MTGHATTKNVGPSAAALMRLRNLELRARLVMEGFWHGLHRSPLHGSSVEFSEYRPYSIGDDPRDIDWRVVARTDRHYIRKHEEETNLRCPILVDLSTSMDFGSGEVTKVEYARTLAATLAFFLSAQGDAPGLLTFDSGIVEYVPPRRRPGHLRTLLLGLEKRGTSGASEKSGGTNFEMPFRRVAELARRRGMVMVVSDFLAPVSDLEGPLGLLVAAGHEVIVFQVLDPVEREFRWEGAARFRDMETGREMVLDPVLAGDRYRERMGAHLEAVSSLCGRLGVQRVLCGTEQPLERVLQEFMEGRSGMSRVRRMEGSR
jgi:uncharacterized protein (DUF58 family)